jgi:hypothetical protein
LCSGVGDGFCKTISAQKVRQNHGVDIQILSSIVKSQSCFKAHFVVKGMNDLAG